MKRQASILLLFATTATFADHRDELINTATELRDWCKTESESALAGKGLSPANWTASYYDKGDVLVVNGSWRVDAAFVKVECRSARGARAEHASMTILDDAP